VLFVPYTPNSKLGKDLRKVEDIMETLSGMRMKIVEKAGVQLKRILFKTIPWAGWDCQREECLACQSREETGEGKGKACYKRNIQQNRNQKSEFNSCSLPKLTVKLGDKELGDLAKTIREE
jgi:hypothetical protein